MLNKTAKFVGGAIAAFALLVMAALPASANTADDVELTSGNIDLFDMFGNPIASIPVGSGANHECSPASNTVTFNSDGTWTGTFTSDTIVEIPAGSGDWWRVQLTITVSGTWGSGGTVVGSASANATVSSASSSTTCSPTGGPCSITAGSIAISGSVSAAAGLPTLSVNDTGSITGSNSAFNTSVTGAPGDCGFFLQLDNGSVSALLGLKILSVVP